jgi:general secretion pathway protein D
MSGGASTACARVTRHPRWLWAAALLWSAAATAGCATSAAMRQARQAEAQQDYDRAVASYTTVLQARPADRTARTALERSRLLAARDHVARGRRFAATGKYEEAIVQYELAAGLNPDDETERELGDARAKLRAKTAGTHETKTELQTLIERTRDLPPLGLDLPQNVKMPALLLFRDASSRDVLIAIARFANLNLVFDPAFRDAPLTIDLRNGSLQDALNTVTAATRTFVQVVGARTIAVIPDTPAKRAEYEQEVVQTFYLSNADLKEAMDMLRLVIDARRIAPTNATNALTIKDTPEHVAAAGRIIAAVDKARPEVVIDVELLEVDRTKLLEYGLQIASPGSAGINGQATAVPSATQTQGGTPSLQALATLSSSQIVLANLPSLYYRLLRSDTNTRTLANPQLRTSDGLPAQARFGDRVPIPVTTFAPIATGGTPQQPITSYNYENVGVNVDITPRTHIDGEVTLTVKVEVSAIEGTTGFGGLPEFSNRQIDTVIRLRDGETSLLAGLIRQDETKVIERIPGLGDIPGMGRLFSHSQKQTNQTDVILTLTPHIIRTLEVTESDLRSFQVGRDALPPAVETRTTAEAPPELARQPAVNAASADLTGTWSGSLTTLPGTPPMTWTLVESGASVNGSVVVAFQGLVLLSGQLSGTLANGTLTYTITVPAGGIPTAPTCSGQLTGSGTATGSTISGTAAPGAISCVPPISSVSFVLSRQ